MSCIIQFIASLEHPTINFKYINIHAINTVVDLESWLYSTYSSSSSSDISISDVDPEANIFSSSF